MTIPETPNNCGTAPRTPEQRALEDNVSLVSGLINTIQIFSGQTSLSIEDTKKLASARETLLKSGKTSLSFFNKLMIFRQTHTRWEVNNSSGVPENIETFNASWEEIAKTFPEHPCMAEQILLSWDYNTHLDAIQTIRDNNDLLRSLQRNNKNPEPDTKRPDRKREPRECTTIAPCLTYAVPADRVARRA